MIPYLRFLAGEERSREANRHLGFTLAFVAGAVNAGGFLAVARFTSHMTGVLSSLADHVAQHRLSAALTAGASFGAFVAGAMVCSFLIIWARRIKLKSRYALVLMAEAALLLAFGVLGHYRMQEGAAFVPATVILLSFVMGLQNAMITKLSGAEIRTTHMTGNATDLGIELAKALYLERHPELPKDVQANFEKLKIHASLIALFFAGGVAGSWGFLRLGFWLAVPLAGLLFTIAAVPILDDLADDD